MRPLIGTAFALSILLSSPPLIATSISDLQGLLVKSPLICGNFTQSKILKALNRPLLSRGRIVFSDGKGVLWQLKQPFASTTLWLADSVVRWDENGKREQLPLANLPQFKALSDVFLAVFTGDTGSLGESFVASTSVGGKTWTLTLRPRDKSLSDHVSEIRVSGGEFVEKLEVVETRGDRTHIGFDGMQTDKCVLSDAENGYFAR